MNAKINSKYFGIILLIINFLFISNEEECGSLDESNCLTSNNCKYFHQDNSCFDCSSLTNANSYYTKKAVSGETKCLSILKKEDNNNYILIYGTKEVFEGENCNSLEEYRYKLGDICYNTEPDSSTKSNSEVGDYVYECSIYFYIEEKDGFKYYNCLEDYNCPSKFTFYNTDTKECTNTCKGTIKLDSIGGRNIYRCSNSCVQNIGENQIEYEYTDKDNKKHCVENCPSDAPYYYTQSSLNSSIYKCFTKCNNNHYSKNGECVEECNEGEKIVLDYDNEIYTCTDNCPTKFPYLYINNGKTYCLKSCQDTYKDKFYSKEISYIYEQKIDSNLVKTCEVSRPDNHYIDEKELKWVSDCKLSKSGPFINGEKCKSSCEGSSCVTYDSYECKNITSTSTGEDGEDTYYIYETDEGEDNICYKNCPSNLGRGFYHEDNKTCTSCSNGFYKKDDKRCYTSCEEIIIEGKTFYHNDGENFCFENGCNNNPIYKYEDPTTKVCYKSCLNISNALFEKDNKCYETDPETNTSYYTLKISDFTKYTKNLDDCFQAGQKYYKGNECMEECNENDYKILPTENEMGQCFSNREECTDQDYKYFNDSSRILSKKCEYFKVVDSNGELITTGNTCIDICPNDFYEDTNNKLCYTNCKYYIEDDSG